jgi:aminoglycoside 6'-N-acetyltransferase I
MSWRIVDLSSAGAERIEQTAQLLLDAFRGHSPAWPDMDSARFEVADSLGPDRISRIAVADDDGTVVGWIGGQPHYDGNVWELHPIAVAESHRRQGIGRALVRDLEQRVAERGALTLWLGADDESFETSLGGVDLYSELPALMQHVTSRPPHAYEFYTRMGFRLIGVMPDANGRGKPDIYLAKRIDP